MSKRHLKNKAKRKRKRGAAYNSEAPACALSGARRPKPSVKWGGGRPRKVKV